MRTYVRTSIQDLDPEATIKCARRDVSQVAVHCNANFIHAAARLEFKIKSRSLYSVRVQGNRAKNENRLENSRAPYIARFLSGLSFFLLLVPRGRILKQRQQ